jgi:prevent-host-death family protein
MTVNIHEAKTQLSRLIMRVQQGEEITIARAGRPVARLVPIAPQTSRRKPGSAGSVITVRPDFDAPLPKEVLKAFRA